jgi:hypothetical protein
MYSVYVCGYSRVFVLYLYIYDAGLNPLIASLRHGGRGVCAGLSLIDKKTGRIVAFWLSGPRGGWRCL